ncbi:MAG: hypothetical protein H6838_10890 [Planctomycetes bacterium]|nr:hypothetical protein [Planctomycetota bacterium]
MAADLGDRGCARGLQNCATLEPGLRYRFQFAFQLTGDGRTEPAVPVVPDLSPLGRLPKLEVVKLTAPAPDLRDALRRAVRPGVRIEP